MFFGAIQADSPPVFNDGNVLELGRIKPPLTEGALTFLRFVIHIAIISFFQRMSSPLFRKVVLDNQPRISIVAIR